MKKKFLLLMVFSCLFFSCDSDSTQENIDLDENPPINTDPIPTDPVFNCIYMNGNVVLKTQEEVNAFAAFGYCKILGAHLTIGSSTTESNITSLEGLNTLKDIDGDLVIINNPLLTSLNGLQNLIEASSIEIRNNNALINLTGIGFIKNYTGNYPGFHLFSNASLQNLVGLEDNTSIPYIQVDNCPLFSSVQGLENCQSIFSLEITNCPLIQNFSPLSNLQSIPYSLKLLNNSSFSSLQGLNNVTSINSIELNNNQALTSLSALSNLNQLSGFKCVNNDLLTSLSGLESVNKIYSIYLENNNGLLTLNGLQNITESKDIFIRNNNVLNSIQQLSSLIKIQGTYSVNVTGGISINNNPQLTTLNGLQNVTDFYGNVDVTNNSSLTDLCALNNILLGTVGFTIIYGNSNPVNGSDILAGNCN